MAYLFVKDGKMVVQSGKLKVSSSSPAENCCCSEPCCADFDLPLTMILTLFSDDGCSCISQEIEVTRTPPSNTYSGFFVDCNGSNQSFQIRCESEQIVWDMGSNCRCGAPTLYPATIVSCSPLHLVWEDPISLCGGCCPENGTMSAELTEPPP